VADLALARCGFVGSRQLQPVERAPAAQQRIVATLLVIVEVVVAQRPGVSGITYDK